MRLRGLCFCIFQALPEQMKLAHYLGSLGKAWIGSDLMIYDQSFFRNGIYTHRLEQWPNHKATSS